MSFWEATLRAGAAGKVNGQGQKGDIAQFSREPKNTRTAISKYF